MLLGANALADRLLAAGECERGSEVLDSVVQGLRDLRGDRHPDTISVIGRMAQVACALGRDDESESLAREAESSAREVLGKRHPDTVLAAATLAATLVSRGDDARLEEAVNLLQACHQYATEDAAMAGRTDGTAELQLHSSNLAQALMAQRRA